MVSIVCSAPQRPPVAKVAPKVSNVSAKKPGMGGGEDQLTEVLSEVSFDRTCPFSSVILRKTDTNVIFCLQLEMLKSAIQDMEKERDFYFGKLRNIELICQEKEGEEDPTLTRIIDILYATDVSSPLLSNCLLQQFIASINFTLSSCSFTISPPPSCTHTNYWMLNALFGFKCLSEFDSVCYEMIVTTIFYTIIYIVNNQEKKVNQTWGLLVKIEYNNRISAYQSFLSFSVRCVRV